MRVGMKEQRVRKIYAKLVQRNEGIKEAVGNIEWEDLGGSCLEHLVRSWYVQHPPSEAWQEEGAGWGKSVAWPLTQGAWSQFMKASSYTPTCVPEHICADVHVWAPFWFNAKQPTLPKKQSAQNKSSHSNLWKLPEEIRRSVAWCQRNDWLSPLARRSFWDSWPTPPPCIPALFTDYKDGMVADGC